MHAIPWCSAGRCSRSFRQPRLELRRDVSTGSPQSPQSQSVPEPTNDSVTPVVPEVVSVPDWEDLSTTETLHITLQRPVTVVLPIGRVGCGKTTLITTIYDQFQLGPFSGWM